MTRAVGLELKQWGRETSDQARVDTVEVVDEQSGSKGRGGGRKRAIARELHGYEAPAAGLRCGYQESTGMGSTIAHPYPDPYPRDGSKPEYVP